MRKILLSAALLLSLGALSSAQPGDKSWEGIHAADIPTLERNYALPPAGYASHILWGWEGAMDAKVIRQDLDLMQSVNTRVVNIEPGYDFPYEYLSDGWWKMVKTAVTEAKKRGMKVWLIDDAKYPSGFAGGKFSRERPDLKMWALVQLDEAWEVPAGGEFADREVPQGAVSAVAVSPGQPNRQLDIKDGKLRFNAGVHPWTIRFAGFAHKSGDTRSVTHPTHGKDTSCFLHDHLNPEAVDQFIEWTHAAAAKALGKEMGQTVLGFRGDEPEYMYTPWTPRMKEIFMEKKGYDPTPYYASFFAPTRTEAEKRVKADYFDVWSKLFADTFFKRQADWLGARGMAHITHLNNEHQMPVNIESAGDFFRVLNRVQVPGVDVISNHVAPGVDNDFPKLASSVSHVYGKPRAFSETMGAVRGDLKTSRQVLNYQFVRGINFFEYNFWSSKSQTAESLAKRPHMGELTDYINRTSYLLSMGTPGARVAMYYPISTMWLGNNQVYWDLSELSQLLMMHQTDFDYVDDDAFTEALTVGPGYLENRSGQKYYTLIVPPADVISERAWAVIEEFVALGGKLLFWGGRPSYLHGRSFTQLKPFPDCPQAIYEPLRRWTEQVRAALPEPELRIRAERPEGSYLTGPTSPWRVQPRPGQRQMAAQPRMQQNRPVDSQAWVTIESFKRQMGLTEVIIPTDSIRYTHRSLDDGELYFLFNEGPHAQTFTVEFDAVGQVRQWDGYAGEVRPVPARIEDGKTVLAVTLDGYDSAVYTVSKGHGSYDVRQYGAVGDGEAVDTKALQAAADAAWADGGGTVVVPAGRYLTGALFFKDGVDLEIREGATLVSTVDSDDFPQISTRFEGVEHKWRCALLNFDHSRGVHVYGGGRIEGRGQEWSKNRNKDGHWGRPRMICFTDCPGGHIEHLTLRDHASWCLHVLYTDGFEINDLDISVSSYVPSSDGVDLDSSSNIWMHDVYTNVTDDCLSIKSGKNEDGRRVARPSMNILVERCNFDGGHGVAMGSEISGCIRHVVIDDCVCGEQNRAPVRFKSQPSRGGVVEDITFSNMTLDGCGTFIDANMIWRMVEDYEPYDPRTQLRDLKVINVSGKVKSVGNIYGDPAAPIPEGTFRFENCRIEAEMGLTLANVDQRDFSGIEITVPEGEAPVRYVEVQMNGLRSGTAVQ